jgi:hypothetical protein
VPASIALAFVLIAAAPAAGAQTVSIDATDAGASESPADNGQFTVTRTDSSIVGFTVFYDVTGSATAGADYAALSGSVSFSLFQTTATITVNVTGDDGLFEGDETVTVRLKESGSVLVANDTATVDIRDAPYAVTVATGSHATEGPVKSGGVIVSIGAQNQSGSSIIVDYSAGGSASPGTDYASLSGTVSIPIGSSSATIEVTPVADDLIEGDETVEVTLTGTSDSRLPIGDPGPAAVTIADDDSVADDDGDGLTNIEECPSLTACRDTDDDGTPDYQDPDDDGDGVPTGTENAPQQDTDENGVPDYLDNDDDGDGRLTQDEDLDEDGDGNPATNPTDLDDDGVPDYLDADDQGGPTGDLDGDGLSNEREEELGTDPTDPDTDGDGVNDGDEVDDGTDPLDPASFADADGDLVPDSVELEDGSDAYDAASFVDSDGGGTSDHVETVTYENFGLPPGDVQDYSDDWRDTDGDGLPDRLEILIASDPASSDSPTDNGAGDDTSNGVSNAVEAWLLGIGIPSVDATGDFDRDGYPDVMEVTFGMNPLGADETDSDGDGVPNVVELLAGLDIDGATDSDADGVPDAKEIAVGSDPLDANSPIANGAMDDDGDGVSNAIEHVLRATGGPDDVSEGTDTDGDGIGDADEIRFGLDPLHDEQPVPWIELRQSEIGPVLALSSAGGTATATARVGGHQTGALLYDWSGSDNAVLAVVSGDRTNRSLGFSPATLPPGVYRLALTVERNEGDFNSPVSAANFLFSVLTDVEADEIVDSDSDGIADAADDGDARFEFPHQLQAQTAAPMRASAGVRLRIGTTARIVRANSPRVLLQDIANAGGSDGGSVGNSEDNFEYLAGVYDFEVANLPEAGSSVQIVIPQAGAIGEVPEYRKFHPASGWSKFVEDENNLVESAAGSSSACPDPGDAAYQPGLTTGHFCVQLTIEDGGPNDSDADAGPNGIVRDPGGVATPKGQVSVGQGGGSIGALALFVLASIAWLGALRRRARTRSGRSFAGAAVLLCACLFATPRTAEADAFVGVGAGLSFLDPDTAATPFSVEDDQDTGVKIFAGMDISPISRNLSVEAFWADLGEAALDNNSRIEYSLYGAGLSYGMGSVRTPRLSAFLEAGIARLDASANVPFVQQDETLMFFGIAGSFAIQRHWFLQLEYEYFAEDAQFISLSIVKRFRTRTSADARTMPLPDR